MTVYVVIRQLHDEREIFAVMTTPKGAADAAAMAGRDHPEVVVVLEYATNQIPASVHARHLPPR